MSTTVGTVRDDEPEPGVRSGLGWRGTFFKNQGNLAFKIGVDLALLTVAYVLAFVLRFEHGFTEKIARSLLATLPLVLVVKVAFLYHFRAYRGIYKYASTQDLLGLVKATTIGSVVAIAVPGWLNVDHARSVFAIDWLLSIVLLGGIRFATRLLTEKHVLEPWRLNGFAEHASEGNGESGKNGKNGKNGTRRVIIYGAGDAGEMLAREMSRGKYSETFRLVGFIDDNPGKLGKSIHGLPVLGGRADVAHLVAKHKVGQIVIAIPRARGREIRSLLTACEKSSAELKIVPGIDQIVDGTVQVSDIRRVRVEDILGREKVDLNLDSISSYIAGRRILVTGAGGSIGSEICRQLLPFGPSELILFGRGENSIFLLHEELKGRAHGATLTQIIGDVINKKKLSGVMSRHKPEIIFHAGADKHVPLMEVNPDEAVLNNVVGTKNVLEVAEAFGVERVVCVSSDKAVNPTNVMGCCKRIAEMLVQSGRFRGTTACAVRFGNVLGSRGSVIPLFQKQIATGGPITVTHPEMRRYFMTIPEASQLVIQAGAMGEGSDLFLLDMGEPVRIIDLAHDMIRLAGLEPGEDIQLKMVGLRPGEKTFEELWLPTERRLPTSHEKINRVVSPAFEYEALEREIRVLTELAVAMDFAGIVRQLKKIVPEYDPQEASLPVLSPVPTTTEARKAAAPSGLAARPSPAPTKPSRGGLHAGRPARLAES